MVQYYLYAILMTYILLFYAVWLLQYNKFIDNSALDKLKA